VTWVRSEDDMPLHPKILRLSDGAFRLWENALHFANRATTDGKIDKALVPTLNHHGRWTAKQMAGFVAELVPALWVDCGDHYWIHDYDHHQYEATKARVESKRASWRGKKRQQRDAADDAGRNVPGGHDGGQGGGHPVETPGESPPPSRPGPYSSLRSESVATDTRQMVRFAFGEWYLAKNAVPWPIAQSKSDEVRAIADWIDQVAASENLEQTAVIERVMRNFSASEFVQSADKPWAVFAKSFADYWNAPKPKVVAQKPGNNAAIGRGRIVS
jgi:hypothetical protein